MTHDFYLTARMSRELVTRFRAKAKPYGRATDVLRELVQAFVDGRLVIKPPVTSKGSLYHVD